jgi:hypothetical protein
MKYQLGSALTGAVKTSSSFDCRRRPIVFDPIQEYISGETLGIAIQGSEL